MDTGTPGLALLVGGWRLVSNVVVFSDTGETIDLYGPSPPGWMVLEPGGRVMFLFAQAGRKPPTNDADRAHLFEAMTAYTGRVRLDGVGRFITSVDLAWNPAWSGEQTRFFEIRGDDLIIWTPEQTHPRFGDRRLTARITWVRERRP